MSKQEALITLADFAILVGIDRCALASAKAYTKNTFPSETGKSKKGFAKLYRKDELLAWNEKRPKNTNPRQLDNGLAQAFLRLSPHCNVNFRG